VLFVDPQGNVVGGRAAAMDVPFKQLADAHAAAGAADALRFTRNVVDEAAAGDAAPEGAPQGKVVGRVLVALSARRVQGQVTQQALIIILVAGFILTLTFAVFYSRIAQRVQRIMQFAARIAGGDLTARTDATGSDEIGLLSGTLAEMA